MRRLLPLVFIVLLVLPLAPAAAVPDGIVDLPELGDRTAERDASIERYAQPVDLPADAKLSEDVQEKLREATSGQLRVIVRMTEAPLARTYAQGWRGEEQARQQQRIERQQDEVVDHARHRDPRAVDAGRVNAALNAVILHIDAEEVPALAADPNVERIDLAGVYERHLDTTVPQIGADVVQDLDVTGEGITVAVLDTGVDYTHVAFGGEGTREAWCEAYGCDAELEPVPESTRNTVRQVGPDPAYFPTDKVVGGYDYIGEFWPGDPEEPSFDPDLLNPNPNPIDIEGHGTNVADIIGGITDGAPGVAPDVEIVAVRVCGSFIPSCEGGAILQGIDFAMSPTDDPDFGDASDLINMSLGLNYGTAVGDPIADAVDNATAAGILTVASAGNSSDNPYITGTPAAIPSALSVAWTTIPTDGINVGELATDPAETFPMVYQDWSGEYDEVIQEPVHYGDTPAEQLGCDPADGETNPWSAGELDGLIVLVDRGECTFTRKAINAMEAGAAALLIAQNTPDPPFVGGVGDDIEGLDLPPTFMTFQSDGAAIKAAIDADPVVEVVLDPAAEQLTPDSMVTASSRGPSFLNHIKPEIGAPGAAFSAAAGTGDGTVQFGGTSGAAPHVSGSAALLLEASGGALEPHELKALLMNTAERDIFLTPLEFAFMDSTGVGPELAPISRIGAGEVRVDRAHASPAAAWATDHADGGAALSFGVVDVTEAGTTLTQSVTVRNYSASAITYDVADELRYARYDDRVTVTVPEEVTVGADDTATFDVTIEIDETALPPWELDSHFLGDFGPVLTDMELGGYITLTDGDDQLALPWHALPRLSGDTSADATELSFATVETTDSVGLTNVGVGPTFVDDYDLLGATDGPSASDGTFEGTPALDLRAVGLRQFSLGGDDLLLAFGTTLWDRIAHANLPGGVLIQLDTTGDGVFDRNVFNGPGSFLIAGFPPINFTFVADAEFNLLAAFPVQHQTNSTNLTLFTTNDVLGVQPGDRVAGRAGTIAFSDRFFLGGMIEDLEFTVGANSFVPTTFADTAPGGTSEAEFLWTGFRGSTQGVLLHLTGERQVADGVFASSGAPAGAESIFLDIDLPERTVEDVEVMPDPAEIPIGATQQFQAVVSYSDGFVWDEADIATWTSDDQDVVTVDDGGLATGVDLGSATISAEVEGVVGTAAVTVTDPALDAIVVEPAELNLDAGASAQLTATAVFTDESTETVTDDVDWASDDTEVATIDGTGLVTAVEEGATSVTATLGDVSGAATVNVVGFGDVRLSGADRFATAIAVSQDSFGDGEAGAVVLTRSDDFADALAGTPVAAAVDGPILLTPTADLHAGTAAEIERVLPAGGTVYILGGAAAISEDAATAVEALGFETERLAGANRYETAVEIAGFLGDPETLLITTGTNFPDALAAGAAAVEVDGAVLLSRGDATHGATDAYLVANDTADIFAIGGPATRAYPAATAVSGATRGHTAVEVAVTFFSEPSYAGIAVRNDFPDALSGSVHVGRLGGPMLLTHTGELSTPTADYLCANAATVHTAFVYGGSGVVSDATAQEVAARILGEGC